MALIASATYGSYPGMRYEFYAEQTGGSGNSRTIKLTLKLKCGGNSSSSWYGYAVNWRGYVNGTWSGWATVKGTESWNATQDFRTYSTTITTDVGTTSSKAINVGFATDSQIDADWDFSKTDWSFTVGATNRAPSAPSNLTVRTQQGGASLSGTISENINSFYIDWSAASDADGDTIYYDLQEQRNGGSWTTIDGNGTDTAHAFNTVGGEGTSYRYWVDARDSKGAHSANGVYSATITKNVFTMDTLASSSTIDYNAAQLSFTFSGGKNTQSGVSITRKLTCDNGITVYNATNITSSPITVKINKGQEGGTTGPYINWNDIKAKFATSSAKGKGTLTFTLTGTNSNGTTKTSAKAISVNIQTNPNAVSNQQISTNQNESTNYLTIANGNKYFIPDGTKVMRVKWNAATGKLGEPVSYKLYVAYGSGGWNWLADLATGTTYYNHAIAKQTVSQQVKYKIVSVSTFNANLTAEATTPAQTLHFYNAPGLTQGTITRSSTSADVVFTVKTNSSIPNISTTGSWQCFNRGTTTNPVSSATSIGASQSAQTITVKNLTDEGTYDLYITYNDNTGLSSAQKTPAIQIGQNLPVFFVNKYGIGVNGAQANSAIALNVKGAANVSNILNSNLLGGSGAHGSTKVSDLNNIWKSGFYDVEGAANQPFGGWNWVINCAHTNNRDGYKYGFQIASGNGGNQYAMRSTNVRGEGNWSVLYHTNNKPTPSAIGAAPASHKHTPADIGAAPASHTHDYLPLTGGTLTGDLTISRDRRYKAIGRNNNNLEMGAGDNDVFIHNTASGSYLQFHNNGNLYINSLLIGTQTYPVIDRDTNRWWQKIAPVMHDGVIEIGRYIDFHKSYSDGADYTARFDANGNLLWCSTSIAQGSDRKLKENIKYLDDEPALLTTEEESSSTLFKDFIKDFKFATYNYIGSEGRCFGFIAQDIVEHPVSKLLLQEHEMDVINKETREIEGTETTLAYNLADYTSVVAKALQEEIIEKDEKIIELETKLKKQQRQIEKQQKQIDMIIGKLGL